MILSRYQTSWRTRFPCSRNYSKNLERTICVLLINEVSSDGELGLESKDALPAGAFHVALYLASSVQSANAHSPIINAFYSIEWFHDLFDLNRQPIHS